MTARPGPSELPEGGQGPPLTGAAEAAPIDLKKSEKAQLEADLSDLESRFGNLPLHSDERARHRDGVGPSQTLALLERAGQNFSDPALQNLAKMAAVQMDQAAKAIEKNKEGAVPTSGRLPGR